MKKIMILTGVLVFSLATSLFAQTPATRLPTATEVKEQLKQDVKDIKRDAGKMKDAVQKGVKEDVRETKQSVQDVKKAAKKETRKISK
jgi:ElaB/YqjD/DUF883 family membrane-anchored ribosome-binding protein